MDLRQALTRQLQYDTWADQELLGFLVGCDLVPPKAWTLFDHLTGAAALWYGRLRGEQPAHPLWPTLEADARAEALTDRAKRWRELLDSMDAESFEAHCVYATASGHEFRARRIDVFQHLLAHAHYHRGQIAAELRRAGVDPPWTDPILWTRLHEDA